VCHALDHGIIKHRIDPDDDESFINMVEQYGLHCVQKNEIGLIGSMCFIGWSLGCILIPPFADRYGRKPPFIISVGVQFVAWATILWV